MGYINNAPSRLGQVNAANDQNALFLKQFAGEVLSVFETVNVMMPLHTVRTITSGKSASFPAMSTASAGYHTPGESVIETGDGASPTEGSKYLSSVKHNEIIVTINDLLISSTFVANIDEAKNHYDIRSEYTTQMARALAYEADKNLIHLGIQGARVTGGTADRFGGGDYLGSSIDISSGTPTGAEILGGIADAAEYMDTKDVPSHDRYCVMGPGSYYKLLESNYDAINRDYGNDGNGSIATGHIVSAYGMRILKSNHIPTADYVAPAGDLSSLANTDLTGAGVAPQALCFQRSGLATVKLMDLAVESEYMVERQGTLMLCKYAMGHEVLRNECLVELKA